MSRAAHHHTSPGITPPMQPLDPEIYVLYRAQGTARLPFLAAWIVRHRLSAGFLPAHAARHARVLVIGPPDGLVLPAACRVAYIQVEQAEHVFEADPAPGGLFGAAR